MVHNADVTFFIVLPGIYNSGPTHWQTLWEQDPAFVRFTPSDWDVPTRADWVAALEAAVVVAPEPPVLVAHSLACLLVPVWAAQTTLPVAGAMLVAPVDPDAEAFPEAAAEFAEFPREPLPFPSLVVGSVNDHYASEEYARGFAADLGADFVVAGALGHINADSGLGDWPQGREFLARLGGGSGRAEHDV